jgi:hypothetical protein
MAFKVTNKKIGRNSRDINYLGKDFQSFRDNLVEYAKTYFPSSYNDFNEASPGMMFIEMASYIGDVLGYYTDSTLKESLIQYAGEEKNVFALANLLGYKPKATSPAITTLSVYQLCKATSNGELDTKYLLRINEGLEVRSSVNNEITFRTTEILDFNDATDREVSVYSTTEITNIPDYFLVKKKIQAISASEKTIEKTFTTSEAFQKLDIEETNVISIESVIDDNGNKWYEVPYLAQETIYIDYPNVEQNDPDLNQFSTTVPYLLKLLKTSRRFVVKTNDNFTTSIHFGGGDSSLSDELIIPNVKNVGLGLNNSVNRMAESYDPTNFLKTKSYGQAPSANSTLSVTYLVGGGVGSNVPQGDLTTITNITYNDDLINTFVDIDNTVYQFVKNSVAVENEIPAKGGRGLDTIEEIRETALANYASQNRAVTAKDYQVRALSMPTKFGSVSKVFAIGDNSLNANSPQSVLNSTDNVTEFAEIVRSIVNSSLAKGGKLPTTNEIKQNVRNFVQKTTQNAELVNPFAINLYTLGYDSNGKLTTLNRAVKENLKTYLNEFRILTDGVNIIDGFVINIGINFDITVYKNYNSKEVVLRCIEEIKSIFSIDNWQFNQTINLSDIELGLAMVDGVASIQKVEIVNKCGGAYAKNSYDIKGATKNKIIYPSLDPSIFEVKFPDKDIKGRAV